jgi:hypothetical protein
MCRLRSIVAALALFAASATGCDPGYRYKPVDVDGKQLSHWSTTIEGVAFSADPFTILIGSKGTFMQLGVVNESKDEVEVLGGELETKGTTLKAGVPPSPEDRAARTVSAGETKKVFLHVDLGRAASDVLGPSITWVWRVRIGMTEHTLRVPLDR